MIDGASKAQMLWHITLPLMRPTIVTAALFRLIDSLKTFDIIFVMTQGGPGGASDTINIYLFNTAFSVGGETCTVAMMEDLTGIYIDHYVSLDFNGFKGFMRAFVHS